MTIKEKLEKLKEHFIFAGMIAHTTFTVALMALIVFSPWMLLPFIMGRPEPYCYAFYCLWIAYFAVALILAAIVGYIREK